jgi:dihydroneopterin aldolase
VELSPGPRPPAPRDDLRQTVDYREVFEVVRGLVEGPSRQLIEALAETIAARFCYGRRRVGEVLVRVRKPKVNLPGALDAASVEITPPTCLG